MCILPSQIFLYSHQKYCSCMLSFLASLLSSSQTLPESLQFGLSLPSVAGPTQTQSSSSLSSFPFSLYPLRTQLLHLLIPAKGSLADSYKALRLSPLSKIPTRYVMTMDVCANCVFSLVLAALQCLSWPPF